MSLFTLSCLVLCVCTKVAIVTISTQNHLYGGSYSLTEISLDLSQVSTTFDTTAVMSIRSENLFDAFIYNNSDRLDEAVRCYLPTLKYLQSLFMQKQPCIDKCDMLTTALLRSRNISMDLVQQNWKSILIDNSFYPCSQGAYYNYLVATEHLELIIQSDNSLYTMLSLLCVVLFMMVLFALTWIMLLVQKKSLLQKDSQHKQQNIDKLDMIQSLLVENDQ